MDSRSLWTSRDIKWSRFKSTPSKYSRASISTAKRMATKSWSAIPTTSRCTSRFLVLLMCLCKSKFQRPNDNQKQHGDDKQFVSLSTVMSEPSKVSNTTVTMKTEPGVVPSTRQLQQIQPQTAAQIITVQDEKGNQQQVLYQVHISCMFLTLNRLRFPSNRASNRSRF